MSYTLLSCLNCKYEFGDDYQNFQKLMKQGYTADEACDALGYIGPIFECCRRCIKGFISTGIDATINMDNQWQLTLLNKKLTNKHPLHTGMLPAATNMHHVPELCNTDKDFSDLENLNNNNQSRLERIEEKSKENNDRMDDID
jgi:DNA-directed RNA polymerase subunit N (RpoN/RPB10)